MQLVSDIVDSQWRDDNAIQHVTNHALAKSNNSTHRQFTYTPTSVFNTSTRKPKLIRKMHQNAPFLAAILLNYLGRDTTPLHTIPYTHIRFMALWTLSVITRVSQYQNQSGFY